MFREQKFFSKNEAEDNQELIDNLRGQYKNLVDLKGKGAADELMSMIMTDEEPKKIEDKFDSLKDLDEEMGLALEKLKDQGFFEYSESGEMICDLDKFKEDMKSKVFRKLGPIYSSKQFADNSQVKALYLLFKDKKVISKEDYDRGVRETKPFFYLPKNSDEALDIEKIKQSDFYLNFSDVVKGPRYEKLKYGGIEDLDYREVLLSLLIYHPKYLDAYRDKETGELIIKGEDDERRKISAEYITLKYGPLGDPSSLCLSHAREFVRKKLSNLIKKGLLFPEDFSIFSGSKTSTNERINRDIGKKGVIMFDSIRYTLGSKYESSRGFKVCQLDNNHSAIFKYNEKGEREIVVVFDLLQDSESLKEVSGKNSNYQTAKLEQANIRDFDIKEFFPQKTGEERTDYETRINDLPSFDKVIRTFEKLTSEARISINVFSYQDQIKITKLAEDFGINRIVDFAKKYSEEGLRALLNLGNNKKIDKIFEIQNEAAPNILWSIFKKYNKLISSAENSGEEISYFFKGKLSRKDLFGIIDFYKQKGEYLLNKFISRLKNNNRDDDETIIRDLDAITKNILLKVSVIKSVKGISPEDLTGVDFEVKNTGEYDLEDKIIRIMEVAYFSKQTFDQTFEKIKKNLKQTGQYGKVSEIESSIREVWEMMEMYGKNWSKYSDQTKKTLIGGFLGKIKNGGEKTRIYKYKESDKLAVFLRIDDLPGGDKYFGSFNALDSVKGGNMGEALLSKVLETEGRNSNIKAICVPQEDVFAWYINKHGFIANGIIMDYERTGQPFAKIERKKDRKDYYFSNLSEEKIIKQHNESFFENQYQYEDRIVLKFDKSEPELMNEEIYNLTEQKKYIISRCVGKIVNDKKYLYICFEKS